MLTTLPVSANSARRKRVGGNQELAQGRNCAVSISGAGPANLLARCWVGDQALPVKINVYRCGPLLEIGTPSSRDSTDTGDLNMRRPVYE